MNQSGVIRITKSRLVTEGAGLLYGFVFDTSVDGDTISIYDGLDSGSGRLIFHSSGWAVDPNPVMFSVGVRFEVGLYVAISTNVTDASILFEPERSFTPLTPTDILQALTELVEQA